MMECFICQAFRTGPSNVMPEGRNASNQYETFSDLSKRQICEGVLGKFDRSYPTYSCDGCCSSQREALAQALVPPNPNRHKSLRVRCIPTCLFGGFFGLRGHRSSSQRIMHARLFRRQYSTYVLCSDTRQLKMTSDGAKLASQLARSPDRFIGDEQDLAQPQQT